MFPLPNIVPWGLFGGHLDSHRGFPMKIDNRHNFGTRHHTKTNDPIFLCNFGMRNWLRGFFSWFKQVGYIKMQKKEKVSIIYTQNHSKRTPSSCSNGRSNNNLPFLHKISWMGQLKADLVYCYYIGHYSRYQEKCGSHFVSAWQPSWISHEIQ